MRSDEWVITNSGSVLHSVVLDDASKEEFEEWGRISDTLLVCGMSGKEIRVPTYREKLLTPRCNSCCKETNIPEGKGQPSRYNIRNI